MTTIPDGVREGTAAATAGTVRAVFAGPVRSLHSPRESGGTPTRWRSAILKAPQSGAVHVGALGLTGDEQKERRFHGGPTRAVLVYGASHYARWSATLAPHAATQAAALRAMSRDTDASAFGFGAFGENITIDGLDEHAVYLGDRWEIGGCVLQITEPRGPCATLARRWMRPTLADEVRATAAAGWYNAVVREGSVRAGDAARLVERLQEVWSLARVFTLLETPRAQRADVEALRDAPFTHAGLRDRLARRLNTPSRLVD